MRSAAADAEAADDFCSRELKVEGEGRGGLASCCAALRVALVEQQHAAAAAAAA